MWWWQRKDFKYLTDFADFTCTRQPVAENQNWTIYLQFSYEFRFYSWERRFRPSSAWSQLSRRINVYAESSKNFAIDYYLFPFRLNLAWIKETCNSRQTGCNTRLNLLRCKMFLSLWSKLSFSLSSEIPKYVNFYLILDRKRGIQTKTDILLSEFNIVAEEEEQGELLFYLSLPPDSQSKSAVLWLLS